MGPFPLPAGRQKPDDRIMSQYRTEQEEAAQGHGLYHPSDDEQLMDQAEESAQGHEVYRPPRGRMLIEEARASEWISDQSLAFPSTATREGIVDRRQELYDAMRRLESAVARPSGLAEWRIEIEGALANLESSLAEHVAQVEGDEGLFAQILEESPRLAADIVSLRREHADLGSACRNALRMSADWAPATLRRRVNLLLARLAVHRQYGAELVFDAYNVDLAAAD